jgi:hypothetical protein
MPPIDLTILNLASVRAEAALFLQQTDTDEGQPRRQKGRFFPEEPSVEISLKRGGFRAA